jgi:AcrR family transcriptional regulator
MASTTPRRPPPVRRPGGRSSRVRAAALSATLAELTEGGYSGLSLERIASRAGVNKTTLYRRWGTRQALLLEAMLDYVGRRVPVPDTGSLREDLLGLARAAAATATAPAGEAVVRTVAGEAPWDEELAAANRRFWMERFELDSAIVERAVERGELQTGTQPGDVLEAVLAPIYFRLLVTGEPIEQRFLERVVDLAIMGVAGDE